MVQWSCGEQLCICGTVFGGYKDTPMNIPRHPLSITDIQGEKLIHMSSIQLSTP